MKKTTLFYFFKMHLVREMLYDCEWIKSHNFN